MENISSISSYVSTYVAEVYSRLQSSGVVESASSDILLCGLLGDSTCSVKDATVTIKIQDILDRFFRRLNGRTDQTDVSAEIEQCRRVIVSYLSKTAGNTSLKVQMCQSLRNLHVSCENISVDKEIIQVKIRTSSELSTQKVREHYAPYIGAFAEVTEIRQRELAITHAKSEKPVLATWHLADCFACVGYSKEYALGFMLHVDTQTTVVAAARKIVEYCSKYLLQDVRFEMMIVGGADCDNSDYYYGRIKRAFSEASNGSCSFNTFSTPQAVDRISYEDVQKDSFWSQSTRLARSIALDTRKLGLEEGLLSYEPFAYPDSRVYQPNDAHYLEQAARLKCVFQEQSRPLSSWV